MSGLQELLEYSLLNVHLIAKSTYEIQIRNSLFSKVAKFGQFYRVSFLKGAQHLMLTVLSVENDVAKFCFYDTKKNKELSKILELHSRGLQELLPFKIEVAGPFGSEINYAEVESDSPSLLVSEGRGNAVVLHMLNLVIQKHKNNISNTSVHVVLIYNNEDEVAYQELIEKVRQCNISIYILYSNHNSSYVLQTLETTLAASGTEGGFNYVYAIGEFNMLRTLKHSILARKINVRQDAKIIANLNVVMQCCSQGICSTCLQEHALEDKTTQYTYTCKTQEQNLLTLNLNKLYRM